MTRLAIVTSFVLLLYSAAAAQRSIPKFTQFPAKVEKARVSGINFKRNPDARTFRTRLSEAMRRGVNFAGHYIVAGWGCGTGCTNAAIIETRTGDVIWPDEFFNIDATYGDSYSDEQIEYKKNSRLLIIHGRPGSRKETPGQKPGDYYYEWKNNRFRLLKVVPVRTQ